MRILLIIILTSFVLSCKSQDKNDLLLGTWQGVKKELKNNAGNKDSISPNNFVLTFRDDFTGKDAYVGNQFKYSVDGDYLIIGDRRYFIEKLTENELILITQTDHLPDNPLARRLYFKKTSI